MRNRRQYYFLVLLACILGSCNQKQFDSEKELWAHVKAPENGYFHEKSMGEVTYSLTYRPTDVLVKQSLPQNYTRRTVDSLRKKYSDYLYFNLNLSVNNQELLNSKAADRNAFGTMVNQLAFGMGEKVHLISKSRDTLPLADYIYPRMYGMSNSTNILLVYPRDPGTLNQDYIHFTIEDLGFATGEVGFKIPTQPLQHQPQLNFEETL